MQNTSHSVTQMQFLLGQFLTHDFVRYCNAKSCTSTHVNLLHLSNVQLLNAKPRKVELDGGFYRVYDEACRVLHKIKLDKFPAKLFEFSLE